MAVLVRLWDARILNHLDAAHSLMPPYRYLFDVRKIGRTPSPGALVVPPEFAAPPGYEIVPRPAARALAAYVANLRQEPYLFEAPPPPGSADANAAVVGTDAPAGGTNAPAAGSGVPALPVDTNGPASGGAKAPNPQSAIRNPQLKP